MISPRENPIRGTLTEPSERFKDGSIPLPVSTNERSLRYLAEASGVKMIRSRPVGSMLQYRLRINGAWRRKNKTFERSLALTSDKAKIDRVPTKSFSKGIECLGDRDERESLCCAGR